MLKGKELLDFLNTLTPAQLDNEVVITKDTDTVAHKRQRGMELFNRATSEVIATKYVAYAEYDIHNRIAIVLDKS